MYLFSSKFELFNMFFSLHVLVPPLNFVKIFTKNISLNLTRIA